MMLMGKYRFLSAIIFFHGLSQVAFTQGNWSQKTDFGGSARYGAAGFSVASKGYICMGFNGSTNYKDLWEFDPANNSWTQKADCPGVARRACVGFSIAGKGYMGTGYNGSSHLKDLWEYNPLSNSWLQKTDFGGNGRYGALSFTVNGKGYVGFGNEGSATGPFRNDLWEFDPVLNTWTQKTNCPGPVRYAAVGFAIGGKGYITGGGTNSLTYDDLYEFDPVANNWTQKADLGVSKVYPFAFSFSGKGYVGGGANGGINVFDFYGYDPSNNTWQQLQSFPGGGSYIAAFFSIGDSGYVGTGYNGVNYFKQFWEYSLDADTCTVTVYDTILIYDTVIVYDSIAVTDTLIIDVPLGFNPPNDQNTILVYPNPANDHITIDNGNFSLMNGYSLEIKNSSGQQMFQAPTNQQQFFVDLTTWTGNGTYFIFLYDSLNNLKDVRKIIIK